MYDVRLLKSSLTYITNVKTLSWSWPVTTNLFPLKMPPKPTELAPRHARARANGKRPRKVFEAGPDLNRSQGLHSFTPIY